MNGELIYVKNSFGISLPGILIKGTKETKKLFIMSHGRGGNFFSGLDSFLPTLISVADKNALDFLGVSDTGAGFFRLYDVFETAADDYKSWIEFAKIRGYEEIIFGAHSYGPLKIAYYYGQVEPPEIKGLFFLAPSDTYNIWKNFIGKSSEKYLSLAKKLVDEKNGKKIMPQEAYYNPISAQSYWSLYGPESKLHWKKLMPEIKIPVLTVIGGKDKNKFAPTGSQTVCLEEADNVFTNCNEKLEKTISSWLNKL